MSDSDNVGYRNGTAGRAPGRTSHDATVAMEHAFLVVLRVQSPTGDVHLCPLLWA